LLSEPQRKIRIRQLNRINRDFISDPNSFLIAQIYTPYEMVHLVYRLVPKDIEINQLLLNPIIDLDVLYPFIGFGFIMAFVSFEHSFNRITIAKSHNHLLTFVVHIGSFDFNGSIVIIICTDWKVPVPRGEKLLGFGIFTKIILCTMYGSLNFRIDKLPLTKPIIIISVLLFKTDINIIQQVIINRQRCKIICLIIQVGKEHHTSLGIAHTFVLRQRRIILHKESCYRIRRVRCTVENFVHVQADINEHESVNYDRENTTKMSFVRVSVFSEF
jgi:hypothetical protein